MKRSTMWKMPLVAALLAPFAAWSAVPLIPSSSQYSEPSQIIGTLNFLINTINTAITPQTMAVPANPRNLLDNGGMQVQQRGTGTRTCGTTTIPSTAYAADRGGCNVNVTSGAGILQVITANLPAAPLPTFNAAMVFYRNSGALAQPQCVMQEIATKRITPMAGQNVNLSFYAQGLAAMLAEQTTLNAYVFYGTGSDEGLQSFTASPAITPAWTGINSSLTTAFTITSSWARYSTSFLLPSTATEAAVALCWTPTTGGTAGVTDGFRFTGVQLEPGATASAFEFRSFNSEMMEAEGYFQILTEANTFFPFAAQCTSTNVINASIPAMVTFRAAPTVSVTAGGFQVVIAGASAAAVTTLAAATSNVNSINVTTANTCTAGGAVMVRGSGTTGNIQASADF